MRDPARERRWIEHARAYRGRVRAVTLETQELRARLGAERGRLTELARSLGGDDPAEAARWLGDLVACAIAQGALETMAQAVQEDGLPDLAANAARLCALDALAFLATDATRPSLEALRGALAMEDPEATEEAARLAAEAPSDEDAAREAATARLQGAELEAALDEPTGWAVAVLAERLAADARSAEVRPFVERWAGGGWYRAHAYLRAAGVAPALFADAARAALAELDPAKRGRLCGEHPAAAVRALGAEETFRLADVAGDDASQYVRIVALARIAPALPAPRAAEAAARALQAHREDPDPDALEELARCAPWMPVDGAAVLLAEHLARHATPRSFGSVFTGFAGMATWAPLIARVGGDPGLCAAAEAVVAAGGWAEPATP